MMLDLMCAKGREEFYKLHGFIARPTDNLGPGDDQIYSKIVASTAPDGKDSPGKFI